MNDTLKILESRRSCRNFDNNKMVSEEDIQAIIEAGTYAPSGMGRNRVLIIIAVTNKELEIGYLQRMRRLWERTQIRFYGAPVILVVLGK